MSQGTRKINLNENQWQAVRHHTGPMMVLAGPGSGKTTVITCRVHFMLRRYKIPPEKILVVTFSKSAAEQMQKRFMAMAPVQGVTFGTFHAVFYRILRARYRFAPDIVLGEDMRRDLVKKCLTEMQYEIDEDFLASVLNEISLVKNELFDLRYYNSAMLGADAFRHLFNAYEDFKQNEGKMDYDDMLTRCYELLNSEPTCLAYWQNRFPYIMIDEFQDINHVQYECIRLLSAPGRHLFIVGDDDQSIYRFRGSRPEFLLRFPEDYPGTQRVVLDANYRSTEEIIAFSNRVITLNHIRYDKTIVGTQKHGPQPIMLQAEDPNREAVDIATRIKAMGRKGADFNEIAVIYRVNIQSRAFTDAFMHMNIPYRVKDETPSLYAHWVARDLHAYLRLSQARGRGYDPDAERIINKPNRFIGKAFMMAAQAADKNIFEIYATDRTLQIQQRIRIEELCGVLRVIKRYGPAEAIRHIRKAGKYDAYIRSFCEYRKLSTVGLVEVLDELQDAAKPFDSIAAYLAHAEAVVTASQNKRRDTNEAAVTLTTMHSAKGLEFGTVFIAGAIEGLMPYERSKTDAEIEEERRLFYVAATRAKQTLCLSVVRTRYEKPVKPSRFITEASERRQ